MGLPEADALHRQGRLAEAEAECRRAVAAAPSDANALHLLGLILNERKRTPEAIELLRRAAALAPDVTQIRLNLGAMLGPREPAEALQHLLHALNTRPASAELHNNIGGALEKLGRVVEAEGSFRTATRLRHDYPEAHCNLANVLRLQGRLEEAADTYRAALALRPGWKKAREGLGVVAGESSDAAGAAECFRRLVEQDPRNPGMRSAMLYTLHYLDHMDAAALAAEHREWARRFCPPDGRPAAPHANSRNAERKLRVGYVSPDLREHTPPKFISASFEHHDRECFEVFCYSDVLKPDAVTERLRGMVEQWRETRGTGDEELDRLIRADRIDILVDLRGHAADNRLTLFARKPAPLQVNMVGYFNTTGLTTMDYRLSDAVQDPPGESDRLHTERLARVEPSCWCYTPPPEAPGVAEAPSGSAGHITFGSLNKIVKISPTCARIWAAVLEAVPGSVLLISAAGADADVSVRKRLASIGLPGERLTIVSKTATVAEYMEQYKRLDIALDPYPFGGITTTCDALWMGVPVVSLAGRTSVSRAGKSILGAAGLGRLCADDADGFVRIARELAADRAALAAMRRTMRDRLRESALLDHRGFARKLDAIYRDIWREWCAAG